MVDRTVVPMVSWRAAPRELQRVDSMAVLMVIPLAGDLAGLMAAKRAVKLAVVLACLKVGNLDGLLAVY